jgi:hypothetical protein
MAGANTPDEVHRRSVESVVRAAISKRAWLRDAGTAPRPVLRKISDDCAELEDRQVHGDHEAPDHHAQKDNNNRLEQA